MPLQITPELLDAIAQIESGNNPLAVNPATGASGAYQFLPIAWQDVAENYPLLGKYNYKENVFKPDISRLFASKLLGLNLKRLKDKATLDNLLASYNFGIGNVLKGKKLPTETQQYIQKVRKRLLRK